jgi:hypothetical protein
MKRLLILAFISSMIVSCKDTKLSIDAIDTLVKSIDMKAQESKLEKKEFKGLKTSVNYFECFYENDTLVKIFAYTGNPYEFDAFNYYLSNGKLIYTNIEFTELKEELWNTMDTVKFSKENSLITNEKTYFIDKSTYLTKNNNEETKALNDARKKLILDQFNELFEIGKRK